MTAIHLITGGAGFIGSNIVHTLLKQGHRVRVLDNFATGHRANLADIFDDIELVEGDLRSIDTCRRATQGVQYVIHQAALPSVPRSIEDPQTTHQVNATGTLHLLIAAREAGAQRVVYASSSSVYGPEPKQPRVESDRPSPISPYAVSKLAGEQYCKAFFHSYGLETVSLRYFNVFGPRQGWDSPYAAVLPKFIRAVQRGNRPSIFGDGEQSRDFTYIDNVVHGNLLAAKSKKAAGTIMNLSCGSTYSVKKLLQELNSIMGTKSTAQFKAPRSGEVRHSYANISLAKKTLQYKVKVDFRQGLEKTVKFFTQ